MWVREGELVGISWTSKKGPEPVNEFCLLQGCHDLIYTRRVSTAQVNSVPDQPSDDPQCKGFKVSAQVAKEIQAIWWGNRPLNSLPFS